MNLVKESNELIKKEIEGWLLFFLSREKKLKTTIDKIFEKNKKEYLNFYEKNKEEMNDYKKILNKNQIETFKKLIGIHFEAVEKGKPDNMKSIIVRMDTTFNRFLSKKKVVTTEDLGEIFEICTTREIEQGRYSPLDTYKSALMPSFLVNCYDYEMTEDLVEAQKKLFKTLKKDVLLKGELETKNEMPSKESLEEWYLKGVSKSTTAISISNIIWENKTKSIIFEKYPFKKQTKTRINITEYKNIYKEKTDLSIIGKLTDFVFKMNDLEVTNFETETDLKEIGLLMKEIDKENFMKNEKEVSLIYLSFINSLLKEKRKSRDEEFEKPLILEEAIEEQKDKEKKKDNQELTKAYKKIEELEKKIQEINYEKTIKEEMNQKLLEENEKKKQN